VGYVSATHKRMDHVVREVATLPQSVRPCLVLLGQQDDSTEGVRRLATDLLGPQGFRIASVGYEQVKTYYGAADCFVLASLKEGFGRVLLEASMHGLPCLVDDNPVMRYVLGVVGVFVNMGQTGDLAAQLRDAACWRSDQEARLGRFHHVVKGFSWQALEAQYVQMLKHTQATGRRA